MLFNTTLFAVFFAVFFVVFKLIARSQGQLWCLLIGSLIFYGAWDVRFVPLLLGTALVDFYVARAIQREPARPRKRRLLAISIMANLGVLAFFKYATFAADSVYSLAHALGIHWTTMPAFDIVLPAGISFYTFQSMSYTIDVYRGELTARDRPLEVLTAISFFPHLVAGPIIRASTLLPQFERIQPLPWEQIRRGFLLVSSGLLLKGIADLLAGPTSLAFAAGHHDQIDAWTGVLAFSGQIYCDFAGYTDMAIGIALLLGFTIPPNFNLPYIATSPIDFWRRWHISLSSWLRDYLYISLGGNRHHHYRNLMLTMLLGGLWHGANWTFVIWGGYHGALLVASHLARSYWPWVATPSAVGRAIGRIWTFYLITVGWTLFRAASASRALEILGDMHTPAKTATAPEQWHALTAVVGALVLGHLISATCRLPLRWLFWPVVLVMFTAGIILAGSGQAFIYFVF